MNRKIPLPLLAGLLALLSPLPLVAGGIVLEVPIPKTNIGGAAAAGGSAARLTSGINSHGALWTPTLGAITPSVFSNPTLDASTRRQIAAEQTIRRAQPAKPGTNTPQDEKALQNAEEAIRTGKAPEVGSEGFQEGLKGISEGTGKIGEIAADKESGEAGVEKSHGIGSEMFDGTGLKKSGVQSGAVTGRGDVGARGFDRRFQAGPEAYSHSALLVHWGVPQTQVRQLAAIVSPKNHPGKQDEVYHTQEHSNRVAGTMAAILARAPPAILNSTEKALLLVAAALHDVDPDRPPGTPARVAATLKYIDTDPQVAKLLEGVGLNTERGRGQLKTLIKFTDFNMDPAAMGQIQADAAAMAEEHFGPLAGRWSELGKLLAFADQSAMYLGTTEFAKNAVDGLALEIRTISGKEMPTNEMIQQGTAKFLAPLADNPFFSMLPESLRGNFREVLAYYERLSGPSAPIVKATPDAGFSGTVGKSFASALKPFRKGGETVRDAISQVEPGIDSPVDKAAARFLRYKRSIAGGVKLSAKQDRDFLTLWMDENNVSPTSALGKGLLAKFYPAEAEKSARDIAAVSPLYVRSAPLIVELGAEMGRTTPQVEALIAKYPEIQRIVVTNENEAATRRVIDSALQRDRVERLTAAYPRNRQGDFLRSMGQDILAPSGKSIEEVKRAGAFAYVYFNGSNVTKVTTGRDPDNYSPDQVFYVTLEPDGRWKIGGYRKNTKRAGTDAEFIKMFKRWLVRGGIPGSAFSP